MVYAGIALLSITSILSYGLNLNVLNAEVCLVGAGIVATIAYFVVKNDMVKALAIPVKLAVQKEVKVETEKVILKVD